MRGQDLLWPDFGLEGLRNGQEHIVRFVLVDNKERGGWLSLDVSLPTSKRPIANATGPDDSTGAGGYDPGQSIITGTVYVPINNYQATMTAYPMQVVQAQTALAQATANPVVMGNSLTPFAFRQSDGSPTPTYAPNYTPGLANNTNSNSSSTSTVTTSIALTPSITKSSAASTYNPNGSGKNAGQAPSFTTGTTTNSSSYEQATLTGGNASDTQNQTATSSADSDEDQNVAITILEFVLIVIVLGIIIFWKKIALFFKARANHHF
jgi:hypothetical protein